MKPAKLLFISILSIFFISSGFRISIGTAPYSTSDTLPVDKFSSVSIAIPAKVYIEQGNSCSLEIEASDDAMEKIRIKVDNEKLIIDTENNRKRIREDVKIYISAPDYEEIALSGSVKLFAEKSMDLEEITLKIAGSGEMSFEDLSAEEVELEISGSGDIHIKGKGAEELEASIAGSGNIHAIDFKVEELNAKIGGSGKCEVWVNGEINASIAGSGTILYKGTPEIDTSVAGSGKVRSMQNR